MPLGENEKRKYNWIEIFERMKHHTKTFTLQRPATDTQWKQS